MPQPATGATTLYGLRRELAPGVPNPAQSRVYYRPVPPLAAKLVRALNDSPEINASGFRQRGIPGPITGQMDLAFMLSASTLLEPAEHIFGDVQKSEPETDIFQYIFTPVNVPDVETTFDQLLSESPVARTRGSYGALSGFTVAFGNNLGLAIRFAGLFGYDTRLSVPVADGGNTGSYTMGPDLRGNLRKPRDGETVAMDVTRDVAGGGIQVKFERIPSGGGAATFPSAALDAAYDSDLNGTWANVAGAYQLTGTVTVGAGAAAVSGTGTLFTEELEVGDVLTIAGESIAILSITDDDTLTLASNHTAGGTGVRAYLLNEDFGYWDENYDPVEFIFPGDSTDHGDIDTGDRWDATVDWSDPSATYISGQRFTSAHVFLDWRRQGATTWNSVQVQTGTLAVSRPVTPSQGTGSRHYFELNRDGEFMATLQLVRKYTDDTFLEFEEGHEPFEMRVRILGERMGTGAYRESIVLEAGAAQVTTRTAPVAGASATVETLSITFSAEDDGSAPVVMTVLTDRDYTVAA
jgi:hypothetical protein